jgi:hypothetical protein
MVVVTAYLAGKADEYVRARCENLTLPLAPAEVVPNTAHHRSLASLCDLPAAMQ